MSTKTCVTDNNLDLHKENPVKEMSWVGWGGVCTKDESRNVRLRWLGHVGWREEDRVMKKEWRVPWRAGDTAGGGYGYPSGM